MTTILVTGATGFLGTHLCLHLLAEGHAVTGLDNFYTGTKQNLARLKAYKYFSFIQGDITENLSDIKATEIYNLACPASPPHYQRDPIYTMKVNVIGAMNLLELARKNNAKILQASTSEVYGDPDVTPQSETYRGSVNITGIRACYDEGKRAAETLFMDYARRYKTRIKIMRIFNTYGPFMDLNDGRVVSNFIVQALRHDPITLYGTGKQSRSFCYVDDLIDGMVRLMNSPETVTGPVNIGNPNEFTMLELAEKIIHKTGSPSKMDHKPLPLDDPKHRCPDITMARDVLGWEPKINLDAGLDKTIAWFKTAVNA